MLREELLINKLKDIILVFIGGRWRSWLIVADFVRNQSVGSTCMFEFLILLLVLGVSSVPCLVSAGVMVVQTRCR